MDYLDSARRNSPLIKEYVGRKEAAASERQRLKAFYTHPKAEVNGDLLFVPIVSLDGGVVQVERTRCYGLLRLRSGGVQRLSAR